MARFRWLPHVGLCGRTQPAHSLTAYPCRLTSYPVGRASLARRRREVRLQVAAKRPGRNGAILLIMLLSRSLGFPITTLPTDHFLIPLHFGALKELLHAFGQRLLRSVPPDTRLSTRPTLSSSVPSSAFTVLVQHPIDQDTLRRLI